MTGSTDEAQTDGTARPVSSDLDDAAATPVPPVAQERTDGPEDTAEFAARLDVDPDRDGVKG